MRVIRITHWGIDYAKLEVNGEEFEISLPLAKAIENYLKEK
jgi:hypothetical protein